MVVRREGPEGGREFTYSQGEIIPEGVAQHFLALSLLLYLLRLREIPKSSSTPLSVAEVLEEMGSARILNLVLFAHLNGAVMPRRCGWSYLWAEKRSLLSESCSGMKRLGSRRGRLVMGGRSVEATI